MNKKGFTLVELLVVIAIIAVLSVIIVPSVVNVNKGINERLYNGKVENVESSASLYASNNDDIFNGQDETVVYVYELIEAGYLTVDVEVNASAYCNDNTAHNIEGHSVKGCLVDPRDNSSLNDDYVILRKQGAGYTATYCHEGTLPSEANDGGTLVEKVCKELAKGFPENSTSGLKGQALDSKTACKCSDDNKSIVLSNGGTANACIISGDNPNNYLKYGDSKANWRVLGIYNVDGTLHAKIITNEPI